MKLVAKKCPHFFKIEENSINDSLLILLPIIMLILYYSCNLKHRIESYKLKNQIFSELEMTNKIFRIIVFFGSIGLLYFLKFLTDTFIIWNTVGDFYNAHNILVYFVYLILLGVFLSIVYPCLMYFSDNLLKYEYLFEDYFEDLKSV